MSLHHLLKNGSSKHVPSNASPPQKTSGAAHSPTQKTGPDLIREGASKMFKAAGILMGQLPTIPLGVASFSLALNLLKHGPLKSLTPLPEAPIRNLEINEQLKSELKDTERKEP